jgi:hypothetical protein
MKNVASLFLTGGVAVKLLTATFSVCSTFLFINCGQVAQSELGPTDRLPLVAAVGRRSQRHIQATGLQETGGP